LPEEQIFSEMYTADLFNLEYDKVFTLSLEFRMESAGFRRIPWNVHGIHPEYSPFSQCPKSHTLLVLYSAPIPASFHANSNSRLGGLKVEYSGGMARSGLEWAQ
jgi:hypothetical protein